MQIRKIRAAERLEVARGDRYAFECWQDGVETDLDAILPDQTFGIFIEGKLGAALRIHRFQQSLRGVVKEMGGIGGVWTYPEHRGKGYVKELLNVAFAEMKAQKQGLSMLIPFKQSFYQKFGYVTANSSLQLKLSISSLNISDRLDWQYERLPATGATVLTFLTSLQQPHGMVIPHYWHPAQWQAITKDRQCVLVKNHHQVQALGIYRLNSCDRTMHLEHYFYKDHNARMGLFNFLAKHRDQIHHVYLEVPFGSNFQQWFPDAAYDLSCPKPAFMVRVIDLPIALANLPVNTNGVLHLKVAGATTFTLESLNYVLGAVPTNHSPDCIFTTEGISALVYGTLSLEEIVDRHWLQLLNPQRRSLLANWFPPLYMHNTWQF